MQYVHSVSFLDYLSSHTAIRSHGHSRQSHIPVVPIANTNISRVIGTMVLQIDHNAKH